MDAWLLAMQVAKQAFLANGTISAPALHKNYILTNGVMTNIMQIPSAKKVFEPQTYTLKWQLIVPTPI